MFIHERYMFTYEAEKMKNTQEKESKITRCLNILHMDLSKNETQNTVNEKRRRHENYTRTQTTNTIEIRTM